METERERFGISKLFQTFETCPLKLTYFKPSCHNLYHLIYQNIICIRMSIIGAMISGWQVGVCAFIRLIACHPINMTRLLTLLTPSSYEMNSIRACCFLYSKNVLDFYHHQIWPELLIVSLVKIYCYSVIKSNCNKLICYHVK